MSGETEDHVSGWTTDTLHVHMQRQVDDLRTLLDERYATQVKAVDAAFLAQQTAMQTALTAAERAVATALLSAEKAVTKAENSNEKRFEAANEWRQQSADRERTQQEQTARLAATFLPREVAETALDDLRKQVSALQARSDRTAGGVTERRAVQAGLSANAQLAIAVVAIIVTVLVANGTFT